MTELSLTVGLLPRALGTPVCLSLRRNHGGWGRSLVARGSSPTVREGSNSTY